MTTSPPPTPTGNEERFKTIRTRGYLGETAESYRPGGYHPVHFDDVFNDRYRVIRKLGDGSFSTVWLAIDAKDARYVALKIIISKPSASAGSELEIYKTLAEHRQDPTSKHVVMLLDNFEHTGPNGRHTCLVFEPMGITAASMLEELPEYKDRVQHLDDPVPQYPIWLAKRMLKHTLLGLKFLHANGVVHGDVQPGNILFEARNLDAVAESDLKQNSAKITESLSRLDGKKDIWAPKHLANKQSLVDYVDVGPDVVVKISDLGAAFWSAQPPKRTVTPRGLRAPELILKQPFNSPIDIWSFGCLLYEFLTGQALFFVGWIGEDYEDAFDDDHLLNIYDMIEPFPETLLAQWPRSNQYFEPDGKRIYPQRQSETVEVEIDDSLEVHFKNNMPRGMSDEEAKVVTDLIRRILKVEAVERPSAAELLADPWFKDA